MFYTIYSSVPLITDLCYVVAAKVQANKGGVARTS